MEIRMEVSNINKYRNIDKSERILIAQWLNQGESNKWIAKQLGRDVSTIGREITRNSKALVGENGKTILVYEPLHAHTKALKKEEKKLGMPNIL
ncbi:MAG: helix-turn-helix domain-containing protein [Kosmotogaceae bacterium]